MNNLLTCILLVSTEVRSTSPIEIYGPEEASVELLIGNGGAGPTCLIKALAEDFIQEGHPIRIGWVQTISRLTLENLKEGIIDIALTYDQDLELKAIEEGYASERTLIFNDHFILVGPKENPAGITEGDSIEEAFYKIAMSESGFFSRDDHSGTNEKERKIWSGLGFKPWEDSAWYHKEHLFPADSLQRADQRGFYTLTDRGTYLFSEVKSVVYVQSSPTLLNRCHALLQKNPRPYSIAFLDYLKSSRAQSLIASYSGRACCPLFTQANEDHFLD